MTVCFRTNITRLSSTLPSTLPPGTLMLNCASTQHTPSPPSARKPRNSVVNSARLTTSSVQHITPNCSQKRKLHGSGVMLEKRRRVTQPPRSRVVARTSNGSTGPPTKCTRLVIILNTSCGWAQPTASQPSMSVISPFTLT